MAKSSTKPSTSAQKSTQTALEFRKTNEAIGLRISEGKLSLLSRKLFNVMVYKAQSAVLGAHAPIDTEANKKYFWIPLSDVAKHASFDSNDTELLKKQLDEMQSIKIASEDEHQWTSERLIASVKFVNTSGLRRRGGTVWVGFAFPPEVFELVMNPTTYTKLSIYYQGLLRSGPALSLYETCRRYATNPSHKTSIHDYGYWYSMLTGNPISDEPPPYKYFKRDILKNAIVEINKCTDIEIELIEHKRGRRIEKLQFEVHLTSQPGLQFPAPPVIDTELMGELEALGFSASDSQDICGSNTEEKIKATLALVHARMASKGAAPLDAPAAYFRWAIKHAQTGLDEKAIGVVSKPKAKQPEEGGSVLEKFLIVRARSAVEAYKELAGNEAEAVMDRFRQSPSAKGIKPGKGLESTMARSLFGRWYATELWGEPTAQALDHFVQQLTISSSAS
jgi:hypothetical protein